MSDSGEVDGEVAKSVLRAHNVDVSEADDSITIMTKGKASISVEFPLRPKRRFLHFLARKFEVPIHHFYHPESVPKPASAPTKELLQ